MAGVLEIEWETYQARKAELLRQGEGQYVLIHGDRVLGIYATESEGLRAGYRDVGLDVSFLLHLVVAEEPTVFFRAQSY